jgi:hypothetical protein
MATNPGPNPDDLRQAKKLLEEIERIYRRLGVANPFSGAQAQDYVDNINDLKDALDDVNDVFHDMDGGVNDILKSWKAIVNEAGGYKNTVNSSRSGLSSLSNITEKLKNHQKDINKLSLSELKKLQDKFKVEKEALKTNRDSLQDLISDLSTRNNLNAAELKQLTQARRLYTAIGDLLQDQESVLHASEASLEDEVKTLEKVKSQTGALGALFEGLGKSLPVLSKYLDVDQAKGAMDKMAKDIERDKQAQVKLEQEILALKTKQTQTGLSQDEEDSLQDKESALNLLSKQNSKMEGMGGTLKVLGKGAEAFGKNLSKAFGPVGLIVMAIEQLVEMAKQVDQGAGDYAKNMNVSYKEALKTRQEMAGIAADSGDVALNSRGLMETLSFVGQQLGTNSKLNEADLKVFTKLREQAGLTNEELYGIQQLSLVNGKSLEQNSKEILGGAKAYAMRNKVSLNEKQILKDVSKASAALTLSLGGGGEKLAEAAAKARQFGLSLEQTEKIANSLLNFEQSIESELSAELLTGKQINLERARQLALEGKSADAAAEIAKQVGTSKDFAKMNVIQQDALAKAAGMEREELAKSLMEREALQKIGAKDAAAAKAKYDELRKTMSAQEAAKALGDASLAQQYEQESIQERFNKAVEKLQEIFVQIAEPILQILDPLMDIVGKILPQIVKGLQPVLDMFSGIAMVIGGIFDILNANSLESFLAGLKNVGMGLFKWIVSPFQYMANAVISSINLIIKGVNYIPGVDIPEIPPLDLEKTFFGDDVFSPGKSGYGKRTLLAPEGAIQLNDDDTVIAGTNLFGNDVASSPGKPTQMAGAGGIKIQSEGKSQGGADMAQTNGLLRELISTIRQSGVVTLDGQKVGEALKIGTYKVQ